MRDPGRPPVHGFCPACGLPSLILSPGGYVTCTSATCPDPDMPSKILEDGFQTEHIVHLTECSFTVLHPLRERVAHELLTCPLGEHLAGLDKPPAGPGIYRATRDRGGWAWERLTR